LNKYYLYGLLCSLCFSIQVLAQGTTTQANAQANTQANTQVNAQANAQASIDENQKKLNEIVDGVQKYYAEIQDFKADFSQKYTYKIYQRKKISAGQVYFKKPSKMRWDYITPISRVFVADGKVLWVYEPEEAQVFKRELEKAQLPVALKFMKGDGKLTDDFNVTLLPSTENEQFLIELKPKVVNGEYQYLRLTINAKTYEVLVSTLIDAVGNENQISFMRMQNNQNLPDTGFQFTVPEGVRVIEGEEAEKVDE
jgi:outer membrane lipoprotein carrier protein